MPRQMREFFAIMAVCYPLWEQHVAQFNILCRLIPLETGLLRAAWVLPVHTFLPAVTGGFLYYLVLATVCFERDCVQVARQRWYLRWYLQGSRYSRDPMFASCAPTSLSLEGRRPIYTAGGGG